ncbi:MAG: glycosyl transferase family 2 [Sphingomonas bacterium]|uniref:glycosyltransferase n=1 Tax=Sphingomonas bacterium TaxID=1895847 RepID=UPI002616CEC1|nr:glycosyltransferase family A protein [Sphingomonas bacterium]MDB5705066.1 glycosyl transferase family 2 [Sphingomonas bacterium]
MLLENVASASGHAPWDGAAAESGESRGWTVLLPFFNERRYLARTITSLAAQDRSFRLILIDNGSTDGGADIARVTCRRLGLAFTLLREARPGKVAALAAGLAGVRTRFVATCDADSWYPRDYLSQATNLLAADGVVAAGAFFAGEGANGESVRWMPQRLRLATLFMPRQCHTGGAGQVFLTASLRKAGGFDPARWDLVLEDHEIMHRILKTGSIGYGPGFWCAPAVRRRDRASIRWTLGERILYHLAPAAWRDRFFYGFLASRLRARRLGSARLRENPYHHMGVLSDATPRSVRG